MSLVELPFSSDTKNFTVSPGVKPVRLISKVWVSYLPSLSVSAETILASPVTSVESMIRGTWAVPVS